MKTISVQSNQQIYDMYFVRLLLVIFCCLLIGCGGCFHSAGANSNDEDSPMTLESLRKEYVATLDEKGKRDIAFRAIDQGILVRGVPVSVAQQLFESDLKIGKSYFDRDRALYYALVDFSPPNLGTESSVGPTSSYHLGWYMVIYLNHDTIFDFKVTNIHK